MASAITGCVARAQSVVHGSGCTLVLPAVLLTLSAAMLAYRNVTEGNLDMPLNGFLANILLQMLPLVALKVKIWTCVDRVSLVPLVLAKTLLMHAFLEFLRILSQALQELRMGRSEFVFDVVMFFAALAIVHYVFDLSLSPFELLRHRDVRDLLGLAVLAALVSEAFFVYVQPSWMSESSRIYAQDGLLVSKVCFVASNYVDIVALMPVVWRLYQAESEHEDCTGLAVSDQARRQVRYFFGFVSVFYLWDDVIDPVMTQLDEPLAMMAHAAHIVLLLDFVGFFLFQVSPPPATKERGEQLQGLLEEEGMDQDD